MMSPHLPSVLQAPHNNSISMERALLQIKRLLNRLPVEGNAEEDQVNASLDDVELMLASINRGD